MDPDLKNELLAILREMREGAPGAWQILVEQRASYCLMTGWVAFGIAALAMIAMVATIVWGSKRRLTLPGDLTAAGCTVALVTAACLGVVAFCATEATQRLAEGFAPLGRVLEALRK